jgi:hypothetical protein
MHTSSLGVDHQSGFKGRAEGKCREGSEPILGHQDKGMASTDRQALKHNVFDDAFKTGIPSTAEIRLRDPHAV